MIKENISQKFIIENIDGTRNYFFEEIEQNELMSKNHKQVSKTLNYIEHCYILASTITGFVSVPPFISAWYSYRNYESWDRIENLCNSCWN